MICHIFAAGVLFGEKGSNISKQWVLIEQKGFGWDINGIRLVQSLTVSLLQTLFNPFSLTDAFVPDNF